EGHLFASSGRIKIQTFPKMRVLGVPYFQRGPHFLLNLCIPSFFGSSNFRAPGSELRSYPAKTGDAGPDKSGYQQDTFFFGMLQDFCHIFPIPSFSTT
uniref:hypothetical protein n=2 Tax=Alistipes putredinis TaxID=28117 RepID=UPI003FD752D9